MNSISQYNKFHKNTEFHNKKSTIQKLRMKITAISLPPKISTLQSINKTTIIITTQVFFIHNQSCIIKRIVITTRFYFCKSKPAPLQFASHRTQKLHSSSFTVHYTSSNNQIPSIIKKKTMNTPSATTRHAVTKSSTHSTN